MTSKELKSNNPILWREIKSVLNFRVFDRLSNVNKLDYNDFIDGKCDIKCDENIYITTSYGKEIAINKLNWSSCI
ncbi:MAG: hypothetical protein ACOCRO_00765 [Halanaerobiales bacterium]